MSHDNFMNYGLGPSKVGGLKSCPTDLYGNCNQPAFVMNSGLGPGVSFQARRSGNCADVLPFSKAQQNMLLNSMIVPKSPGSSPSKTISYNKPPWSGVL